MMDTISKTPFFEAKGIVKDFPGQRALDDVDFDVRAGEVHALIGEIGAGKSTLIKIIAGLYKADRGSIFIDGKECSIASPKDSQNLGLAFIHQELNIIPTLSVAENILLPNYPRNRLNIVTKSAMVKAVKSIPYVLNIDADLTTPAGQLPVIQQWKAIINRALAVNSRIIFMDEPTSSLTHEEVNELFKSIEHLRSAGKAIVYVSHRMEEVFRVADRVTVIRDARKVGTAEVAGMEPQQLYKMMLGRELRDIYPQKNKVQDTVLLEVNNLSRDNILHNVSFKLHAGEILGIAGLVGSGRTVLARLIFGAMRKDGGEIKVNGKVAAFSNPMDAIEHKIALVPEDRRKQGLILSMDSKKNITLASLKKLLHGSFLPILSRHKEKNVAHQYYERTKVKASGLNQCVADLSGGNQQKVVLSKWLCSEAHVLIFDEPTRGIDVGAKFAIYEMIADLARQGTGIILISSDLTEVAGLAHRVIVLDGGEIKTILDGDQVDLKTITGLLLAS